MIHDNDYTKFHNYFYQIVLPYNFHNDTQISNLILGYIWQVEPACEIFLKNKIEKELRAV